MTAPRRAAGEASPRRRGRGRLRRIVIAGGGVAALETLLALRELAGHRVEITLLAPEREFLYRPVTVGEAFERSQARTYDLAEILAERPADHFHQGAIGRVYPAEHVVVTLDAALIPYDALVLATGAVSVETLPGALTFGGREDVPALRALLDDLIGGEASAVAFVIGSEPAWPLPGYELALMTASHLREHGCAARVVLVTPEREPLELFGPAAAGAIAPLLEARGIELVTGAGATGVKPGALILADGTEVAADRVVALPALEGPRVAGVPCDEHGFIPVDAHGRVAELTDVFAAGDAAAFPSGVTPAAALKQGGLAAQQADAVAQSLAAEAGAAIVPERFLPVLRGLLMTGGPPLYLRAEPGRLRHRSRLPSPAPPAGMPVAREASAAAGQPLWWPPGKIAGRYLAPFLASARHRPLGVSGPSGRDASERVLSDRTPVGEPESAAVDAEREDALALGLLLADCDAGWGDFASALQALDAAEALAGTLPPEYERKRRKWIAALRRE